MGRVELQMEKNRIEAFSDAVFAIAVTLLVFNLSTQDTGKINVSAILWERLPDLLAYILSFLIIGVYWVAHHTMMHYIKKVDRNALWINNLTLLSIAFMPFPTLLISRHPNDPIAILVYCLTLSFANLTGSLLWLYVTRKKQYMSQTLSQTFARRVLVMHLSPILIYGLAFSMAFISDIASYVLICFVPAFFAFPNSIFRRLISNNQ